MSSTAPTGRTRRHWLATALKAPLLWVAGGVAAIGCRFPGMAAAAGAKAHHGPDGFRNPFGGTANLDHAAGGLLRWVLGMGPEETPYVAPESVRPYRPPRSNPDLGALARPADPLNFQYTWIGHASFLIQHRGMNILTDPMFSDRASPVGFAGPKRMTPPGVALEDLPEIHLVLISHNHYDHLDEPTVRALGNGPRYLVPLGTGEWFARRGITNLNERDWWETVDLGEITAHCVPAQHFSGRGLMDRNDSLWCGWVLDTPEGKFYFAGDTGYSPVFREIGERLGPMRLSLIPIGAYRPRWFMHPVHTDPFEAVRVHRDVGSRQSVGMHWGTFKLTDEPMGEPPVVLATAARQAGLAPDAFTVMNFGETRRG